MLAVERRPPPRASAQTLSRSTTALTPIPVSLSPTILIHDDQNSKLDLLGHIRRTILRIRRVDVFSDLGDGLALVQQPHHVTRDVNANASAQGMRIKFRLAFRAKTGYIALVIALVPHRPAPTVAWHLFEDIGIRYGKAIGFLDIHRSGADFIRQVRFRRQGIDMHHWLAGCSGIAIPRARSQPQDQKKKDDYVIESSICMQLPDLFEQISRNYSRIPEAE